MLNFLVLFYLNGRYYKTTVNKLWEIMYIDSGKMVVDLD